MAHDGYITVGYEGDSETFPIALDGWDEDNESLAKAVIDAAIAMVSAG